MKEIEKKFRNDGYEYRGLYSSLSNFDKIGWPDYKKIYKYQNEKGEERYYAV